MVLKFTGKGSAFYPMFGSTSGYLVLEDELYIFDCGESVFEKLYQSGLLDIVKNVNIILTHLHADHVGSLGSFISYSYCIQHRTINVIHPNTSVVELLDLLGIKRNFYTFIKPHDVWHNEVISLRPVSVQHVDNMECYGYIVNISNCTFYYSGDSADVPKEIRDLYLAGALDEIYHDTATVVSNSHCHVSRLCKYFPEPKRKKIYCMHLDGDNIEHLEKLGFSVVS